MIVMNGINKAIHINKQHKYFPSEKVDFQSDRFGEINDKVYMCFRNILTKAA